MNTTIKEDDDQIVNFMYSSSTLSGKIHDSLEDPFSQLCYDISDNISDTLYKNGFTPNQITTLRLFILIIAFSHFFKNKLYRLTSILFLVSYFGDCLDGHIARKYNMETKFGDYYDHSVDIFGVILTIYYITSNIDEDKQWIIIIIITILFMSFIQMGCQERYIRLSKLNKDSCTMQPLSYLCPESVIRDDELESTMEFTRLFGFGTYKLFIAILIWNFEYISS